MRLLYCFGIFLYSILLHAAAPFHSKAKRMVEGRRGWKKKLRANVPKNARVYWFHCASLGEFEQGRPLMETLKEKYPDSFILLTFFSPSGYEIRKNYNGANYVCYLPLDTVKNAHSFVTIARPEAAFFIKYEFWANFLKELKINNIAAYSISSIFRKNQRFFQPKGTFSRSMLRNFTYFFVQNEKSKELLHSIGIENCMVSGDTRYDRVATHAKNVQRQAILEQFCLGQTTLVVGSSWSVEEEMLIPLIQNGTIAEKVILAPHEVHEKHIQTICNNLKNNYLLYSNCGESSDFSSCNVLVLDCVGVLASAYSYGTYAYIGGAFGKGLHNILEPASFGLPVLFGPNHAKFPEAEEFIQAGIGFSIKNEEEWVEKRKFVLENQTEISKKSKAFMQLRTGAVTRIMEKLNL